MTRDRVGDPAAVPQTGKSAHRPAGLNADFRVARGEFTLELDLDIAPGQVVALLGPNGAGKTSALRALAGLVSLADGFVRLDSALLDGIEPDGAAEDDEGAPDGAAVRDAARRTAAVDGTVVGGSAAGVVPVDDARQDSARAGRRRERRRYVPTERRAVAMVFQDYLLFPHLSAADNVAFGLRCRGMDRRAARVQARDWLVRVGLGDQASSRPAALSGGQAQRVAIARALVTHPRLLLLDEPLVALDAATRMAVRTDLRRHLDDFDGATVLVTHDPLDAMILADRLVVIEDGRVVQRGGPAEVARAPRTRYVAQLLGLNLYRGTARGTEVAVDGGGTLHLVEATTGDVFVTFPPSAVVLHRAEPSGSSARNAWPGRVTGIEQHATTVRVAVDAQPAVLADVTAAAVAELDLSPGVPVWVSVKATETHAYPA